MTDNEIIKALECCSSTSILDCADCPYWGTRRSCGVKQMKKDALNLINRQKAEIEELQKYKHDYYVLKAKAVKEFAKRLKDKHKHNTTSVVSLVTVFDNINSIVEEMVGEENGQ